MMRCLIFLFLILVFSKAHAVEEFLPNSADEQRAIKLFEKVRCTVCNGQSIKESSNASAQNIREQIRSYIVQNFSDEEILLQLKNIYGDDILFDSHISFLWKALIALPFLLILGLIQLFKNN